MASINYHKIIQEIENVREQIESLSDPDQYRSSLNLLDRIQRDLERDCESDNGDGFIIEEASQ